MAVAPSPPTSQPALPSRVSRLLEQAQARADPDPAHREAFAGAFWAAERDPPIIRLAAGVANTFRMMPAVIQPHELIVGGHHLRQIVGFSPEEGIHCDEELAQAAAEQPERAPQIERILEFWRGNATADLVAADRSPLERLIADGLVLRVGTLDTGGPPDFAKALAVGLQGIQADLVSRRNRLLADGQGEDEAPALYAALLLVADGIIEFAHNHSLVARQLADREGDARRKAELRQLAAICRRMPARPAATFHEAVQSVWFLCLLHGGARLGALDDVLWPYLRRDLETGELTLTQAQELVDCLWLKLGRRPSCAVSIGRGGRDEGLASGSLTDLCLNSQERLYPFTPRVTVHAGEGSSADMVTRACRLAAQDGAVQFIGGDESQAVAAEVGLAKCLELALNNGACRKTKRQLGPRTGDPRLFASYQHVLGAYKAQVQDSAALACDLADRAQRIGSEHAPDLCRSLLAEGAPPPAGGWILGHGMADTAGSLSAVSRLVFREWDVALAELVAALDADFQGFESLQQRLRSLPGFAGRAADQDGDEADVIAAEVAAHWSDMIAKHAPSREESYVGGATLFGPDRGFGRNCGALPDGRPAWAPLEAWPQPGSGTDLTSAAAALRSAARVGQALAPGGAHVRIRLTREALQGGGGAPAAAALVRDYLASGGGRIEITVADEVPET